MILVMVIIRDGYYSSEEVYGPFDSTEEAAIFLTAHKYWQEPSRDPGWWRGKSGDAYVRTLLKPPKPTG